MLATAEVRTSTDNSPRMLMRTAYRDDVACGYLRRAPGPRCGRPMSESPGPAAYREGGMELAQAVYDALHTVLNGEPASVAASSVRWGGEWHCPADGTPMQESQGQVRCPACGRNLPGSILYQLIEFHIHRAAGGKRVTSVENPVLA